METRMEINPFLLVHSPELAEHAVSLCAILDATPLCTIATVNPDGTAHANTAYFATDDMLNLYILSSPKTQHSDNVAARPRVSITIFDSSQAWGEPHAGVQIVGVCTQVARHAQSTVFTTYAARFPALRELAASSDKMLERLESRFYGITVERVRLIDEHRYGAETSRLISVHALPHVRST
jgi:uncharacterized protein YhbP (UPF0306 family)